MDTDSSCFYEPTYSEDERIESYLKVHQRLRKEEKEKEDFRRRELFESFEESDLELFNLPGLIVHTFRHDKIKICFHPSAISQFVNPRVKFYISLRYSGSYWKIKRDSLPANYKRMVYSLFYGDTYYVDDSEIFHILTKTHNILINWTHKEQEFRLEKNQRFRRGEEIELDSDDMELFFDESEKENYREKKKKILNRMKPPKSKWTDFKLKKK